MRIIVPVVFVSALTISAYGQTLSREEEKLAGAWACIGSFMLIDGEWEKVEENIIDTINLWQDHSISFRQDNKKYNIFALHIGKWKLGKNKMLQISERQYYFTDSTTTEPDVQLKIRKMSGKKLWIEHPATVASFGGSDVLHTVIVARYRRIREE